MSPPTIKFCSWVLLYRDWVQTRSTTLASPNTSQSFSFYSVHLSSYFPSVVHFPSLRVYVHPKGQCLTLHRITSNKYLIWFTPAGSSFNRFLVHSPVNLLPCPGVLMVPWRPSRFSTCPPGTLPVWYGSPPSRRSTDVLHTGGVYGNRTPHLRCAGKIQGDKTPTLKILRGSGLGRNEPRYTSTWVRHGLDTPAETRTVTSVPDGLVSTIPRGMNEVSSRIRGLRLDPVEYVIHTSTLSHIEILCRQT